MSNGKIRIAIPRQVLLIEIERRCPAAHRHGKVRIGLTRHEALAYKGFECDQCGKWWEDSLTERDLPEWWDELVAVSRGNA